METLTSTKLKVGITAIVALIILLGGIFWVKKANPLAKRVRMSVVFDNAKRIEKGDPINLAGIKIGQVDKVFLGEKNNAIVSFSVPADIDIYSDAVFTIEDVGFMGDKALVIDPGKSGAPWTGTKTIYGSSSLEINDLVKNVASVIAKMDSISAKIDNNLDINKLTRTFKETADKIQSVLTIYEKIAIENRDPLNKSIKNINMTAGELRDFIKRYDPRFDSTLSSFKQTSDRISDAVGKFDKLPAAIDTMTYYINNGDGTLSKLLKSAELYNELRKTNANMDSLIKDFKKNPGKYTKDMNFKLRLF